MSTTTFITRVRRQPDGSGTLQLYDPVGETLAAQGFHRGFWGRWLQHFVESPPEVEKLVGLTVRFTAFSLMLGDIAIAQRDSVSRLTFDPKALQTALDLFGLTELKESPLANPEGS